MARLSSALSIASAAAWTVVSGPACAQRTTEALGSHIQTPAAAEIARGAALSPSDRGRLAMGQYASCLLDSQRTAVSRALKMPAGPDQQQALAKLSTSDCLMLGELRFSVPALRGALFTELYGRKARGVTNLPLLDPIDLAEVPTDSDEAKSHWWLMYFADCVVRKDPASAKAFVLSSSMAGTEKEKMQPLVADFGPCVPAGQQIALSSAVIKNAIAEVLYRGVQSPTPANR